MSSRANVHARTAAAALLTAAFVCVAAQTAQAHAVLEGSSPKDGASIRVLPDDVTLEFNENVATPAFVNVIAPDGSNVAAGEPSILDNTVTQAVDSPGEAGTYRMSYRVVSADGHPVSATLTFTVTTGRHVAAPRSQPDDPAGPSNVWVVVAVAVTVAAGAVIVLLRLGRRRGDTAGDD